MRNCCLPAQEDEHRAQSWSFQIARGYHEGLQGACAGFLRICEFAEGIKAQEEERRVARRAQVCARAVKVNFISKAQER
jgi:hypothetical protein